MGNELQEKQTTEIQRTQQIQPMNLISMAVENNADVDKLEKLMALADVYDKRQAEKSYNFSMSEFQSDLPVIKKLKTASFPTKNGGKMQYNYASLDDISEQIKPYLKQYGFSYRFEQDFSNGIRVKCILTHADGHSQFCEMVAPADTTGNKNVIQQSASTITYLRRYTLTGVLGIATADQDIDGRLPEKPIDIVGCQNVIINWAKAKGKSDAELFEWMSKVAKHEVCSFDDLSDQELVRFAKTARNAA